jgi:hypothetical protein
VKHCHLLGYEIVLIGNCTQVSGEPATSFLTVIYLFFNYPEDRQQFTRNVGYCLPIITALYQTATLSYLQIKPVIFVSLFPYMKDHPMSAVYVAVNAEPVLTISARQPKPLLSVALCSHLEQPFVFIATVH